MKNIIAKIGLGILIGIPFGIIGGYSISYFTETGVFSNKSSINSDTVLSELTPPGLTDVGSLRIEGQVEFDDNKLQVLPLIQLNKNTYDTLIFGLGSFDEDKNYIEWVVHITRMDTIDKPDYQKVNP